MPMAGAAEGDTALTVDAVVAGFGDLPTLAPVAIEVIRLAEDERSSMADLAQAISADPGLTARILRLANSAMYGQTKEITSLDRATAMLGIRNVKLVSLGFTLIANVGATEPIDTDPIWQRSLATSVLARRFATEVNRRLVDDVFVAGLLGNVGKLALIEHAPYVEAVIRLGQWMTVDEERRALGFSSDEVTARILEKWELPRIISSAIRSRNEPGSEGEVATMGGLLAVADAAAELVLASDDHGKLVALDTLTLLCESRIGLPLGRIEALIDDVTDELDEISTMFDLSPIGQISVSEVILSAQQHLLRLSLDLSHTLSKEQERIGELTEDNERLATEASTDPLTGLPNRRTFDDFLATQISSRQAKPRTTELGLFVLDLDHFKSINDRHGHQVGDEVLRAVGHRIRAATRRNELSARIGGEEFAVVLPDTSAREVSLAAERFRMVITEEPVETLSGPLAITASVGASYTRDGDDLAERLYIAADAALYESKERGRNRTTARPLDD